MPKTANYTRKAVDNYKSKKDIVSLTLEKGTRERIEKLTGEKPNEYIYKLLYNALDALEGVTDLKAVQPEKKIKKSVNDAELSVLCENVDAITHRKADSFHRSIMSDDVIKAYEQAETEEEAVIIFKTASDEYINKTMQEREKNA